MKLFNYIPIKKIKFNYSILKNKEHFVIPLVNTKKDLQNFIQKLYFFKINKPTGVLQNTKKTRLLKHKLEFQNNLKKNLAYQLSKNKQIKKINLYQKGSEKKITFSR